jgi:hypothetical protein
MVQVRPVKERVWVVEWVWGEVPAWEPVGIASVLNAGIKAPIPRGALAIQ